MKLIKYGLIFLAVGVLASCSSNEEKKALEPLPLVDIEQKVSLKKQWSSGVGKGLAKKLYTTSTLAVEGQSIFSADQVGNVFAFDLNTGKTLWKTELDIPLSGTTSVTEGQVYVGTYDGLVIALSAADGSEIWRAEVSGEVLAPPQSNGNQVVVSSINGALTAFKAENGEHLWTYGHVVPALTNRGLAAPVVTSTQVMAAFDNGQMLAFDVIDGSSLWETRVAQPTGRHDLERIVDIDGTPLLEGGFLYVASYQGVIAAVARAQGRIAWKQDISSYQPLVYSNRKIFATTAEGKVLAYNSNTGAVEWENSLMLRRTVGAPAVIGDYVAVIDGEGYLHLLDQNDGTFVGRIHAKGERFRSPMLSHEDKLYVLSGNGKLTAYRLAN